MAYKFQHIAIGGTFDLLHKGHEKFIKTAFLYGKKVSIGISGDSLLKKFSKKTYQNQAQRKKEVISYLVKNKYDSRSKIIILDDIYGTTLKDKTIDAVVSTKDTLANIKLINEERFKKKLKKLKIIKCSLALAFDKRPITSGRIRNGEIDRSGKSYFVRLLLIADKRLSEEIRIKLKKPLGKLIKLNKKTFLKNQKIIAIGDVSVASLLKIGTIPHLSIVDFMVNRKPQYTKLEELGFSSNNPNIVLKNPPGQISKELIKSIAKSLNKAGKTIILVKGEEDLAALPAILMAPLRAIVFYGQPDRGLVMVNVDEEIKNKLCGLLNLL